jgi:hypothetical protein
VNDSAASLILTKLKVLTLSNLKANSRYIYKSNC